MKDKKPIKSSVPAPKTEEKQNIFSSLTKGIKLIWKNPTARWVTIGQIGRFWEFYTAMFFMPAFIMASYPAMVSQFAVINALVYTGCGMSCNFALAILSDRLEKRSRMAKAMICVTGTLLAAPLMAGACLFPQMGFYFSMICLALKFCVAEGYVAPSIAMM